MGQLMGSGVLALWIDVEPDARREVDAWYIDEHLPDRVFRAGYRRARRFAAVEGAPQYLTLFEAETPEALASPGYLALVRVLSDQSRRLRATFSNVARNTFRVRGSSGKGLGGCVASLRLGLHPQTDREAAMSTLESLAGALSAQPCVVGVHLLEADAAVRKTMDAQRITGLDDSLVDVVILVEGPEPDHLRDAFRAGEVHERLRAAGWSQQDWGIYRLSYEISHLTRGDSQ